eukprot:1001415-Prymnesium_polylepis.1
MPMRIAFASDEEDASRGQFSPTSDSAASSSVAVGRELPPSSAHASNCGAGGQPASPPWSSACSFWNRFLFGVKCCIAGCRVLTAHKGRTLLHERNTC